MYQSNINKINCLYYPFSRLLDSATLKSLLLVFDSITFLDDIHDSDWRAYLLKMLARENKIFSTYDELADDYDMLTEIKAVHIVDPKFLKASNSTEVAISTLADLSDPKFISIAANPARFGLPYRPLGAYNIEPYDKPTWQIFLGKIANPLLEDNHFLEEQNWSKHILLPGTERRHWTFSYEAGSAAAVNLYLEASQELNLTPITTSQLHHELVLRKLKRIFNENEGQKIDLIDDIERKKFRTIFGQGEIIRLLGNLFPITQFDEISFADIVKFRNETEEIRSKFVATIDETLRIIDSDPRSAQYDKEVIKIIQDIKKDFKNIESSLTEIRDKILPAFTKAIIYGTAGGGALGTLVSFLGGLSTAGIVGASALTISGALLTEAMKLWNEKKKIIRNQSAAISYLTKISQLVKK